LGVTFMESSAGESMSMYVAGRNGADAAGTMETPVRVTPFSSSEHYTGTRAGDYGGLSVDPVDGSFWAANEYKPAGVFWGTWVTNFNVSAQAHFDVTAPASPVAAGQAFSLTVRAVNPS